MGVDPSEYDIGELRDVDGDEVPPEAVEYDVLENGFHWATPSERTRLGIEDPTPEQRDRLLALEGVDADDVGEKPYLGTLPDDADAVVLDWLSFLADEAGYDGALAALARYRDLGWFTESVETDLRGYMLGVGRPEGNGLVALDRTDHLLSFAYVVKISSFID